MRGSRNGPGLAMIVLVAAILGLVPGCGGPAGDERLSGVVVDVDANGLDRVRGFTVRSSDGDVVEFQIGALEPGSFPPGHLTEHAATAQPVIVTYRIDDGMNIATKLEDAPTDGSSPTASRPRVGRWTGLGSA